MLLIYCDGSHVHHDQLLHQLLLFCCIKRCSSAASTALHFAASTSQLLLHHIHLLYHLLADCHRSGYGLCRRCLYVCSQSEGRRGVKLQTRRGSGQTSTRVACTQDKCCRVYMHINQSYLMCAFFMIMISYLSRVTGLLSSTTSSCSAVDICWVCLCDPTGRMSLCICQCEFSRSKCEFGSAIQVVSCAC